MAPAACPTTWTRPQRTGVALLALVLLAGCEPKGTQPLTRAQLDKIEVNLTSREVVVLLGEPVVKSDTLWTYRPSSGPVEKLEISFDPDRGGNLTADFRVTSWHETPRTGSSP